MSIKYVIVHRDSDPFRTRNLKSVVKYVKTFGIDVMVIEQDNQKKIESLCNELGVEYQFIYNPGLFNRAWAFNCLKNFSNVDKVVFADNDIIINENILKELDTTLDSFDVVRPFDGTVFYYDEPATREFVESGIYSNRKDFRLVNIFNLSGGVCAFRTDSFYNKIGGFDERFEGWGGEDDEMHKHLLELSHNDNLKIFSYNLPGIHLNHSRNYNEGNWQPNYNKNVSYIHDNKRNENLVIGNINRYE